MAVLSSLVVRLATNSADFTSGIAKSTKGLQRFARQVRGIQKALGRGIATGAAIIAADSIRNAAEFGDKLQDLQAITGASGEALDTLRDQALDFGRTTTKSAEEALTAFKLVGSAKPELLSNSDALSAVTKQVVLLAEAARLDLPTAVDATTVSLNQFGASASEAARFVNILAAGSKFGASEVRDTALAIRESGTIASQAGLSFEELNALIQLLAEGGIKGAKAGTALRTAIVNLESQAISKIKPSTDGATAAFRNLAAAQLSTADRAKLFGKEALSAANILVDGVDKIDSYTQAVTGTKTANEQAAVQSNSLVGDLKRLGSAYDALSTQIGQKFEPAQRGATQSLTDIVKAIDLIIEPTQSATKNFGVFDFVIKGLVRELVRLGFILRFIFNEVTDLDDKLGRQLQKVFNKLSRFSKETKDAVSSSIASEADQFARLQNDLNDAFLKFDDNLTFGDQATDGLEDYQKRLKELQAVLDSVGAKAVDTGENLAKISIGGEDDDRVRKQLQQNFDAIRQSSLSRERFIFESLERDKAAIADAVKAIPALAEEAVKVIAALELQAGDKLNKLAERTKKETQKISTFAEQAARNMQTVFADFLFDPFDKGLKGMLKGFIDIIRRMIAEAAAAKILQSLGILSGGTTGGSSGGGLGSILSGGLGAILGGSGGAPSPVATGITSSFLGGSKSAPAGASVIIQQQNDFRSADSSFIQQMPAILDQQKRATVAEVSNLLQRGLIPTG